jgi:hypothetical protein
VIRVGLAIGSFGNRRLVDPVGTIQQLCSFQDHLHHVFIAVKASRFVGIERQEEDVHGGRLPSGLACVNPF